MKVASILEEARWGGPQSRLVQTAKALSLVGVDHMAIIPQEDSERLQSNLNDVNCRTKGLNLTRMENRISAMLLYLILLPFDVFKMARVLLEEKVDVVHVQGGAWQLKGVIAGKLTRCKVVWHLNDTSSPWFIRYTFKLIALLFADQFIVQGRSVKDYYLTGILKNAKYQEVFGIVDDKFITQRNKFFFSPLNVITVGTITQTKGYDLLLEVAKEAEARGLDVRFRIAGRVNRNHQAYFQFLQEKMANQDIRNVTFLGECLEVDKLLADCSLYLCCSRAESSPTSVWEGMAMGLPVVTTNVGNVYQVIREGHEGFICDSNATSLTDRIESFSNNPKLLENMGEKAHLRIKELFGCMQNGEVLKSIYQRLL